MKRFVSIVAVVCFCVGMFTSVGAAKTYKMAAFPIPLMVVDNQQGVFILGRHYSLQLSKPLTVIL